MSEPRAAPPVQAAIIGFGGMGRRHLQALGRLGVQVVAVADTRTEARAAAETAGVPAFESWRDALESTRPALAIVATNAPSHCEIVAGAARLGASFILCEKPIAGSLAEADRIIEACRSAGARLAVNHQRRANAGYLRLRDMLQMEDAIGPFGSIVVTCRAGGLAAVGIHFFDLMRMLAGSEPQSAVGWERSLGLVNPRGMQFEDPGGYGVFTFQNGVRAFIDMSEDIGVPQRIEIVGSYGRAIIDEPELRWTIEARRAEDRQVTVARRMPLHPVPFDHAASVDVVDGTTDILRNLLSAEPVAASGGDGRASLEMYIGLRESMANGHMPVAFPLEKKLWPKEYPIT